MSVIPQQKIDRMQERWHAIQHELNAGPDHEKIAKLSKEFAQLDPLITLINELQEKTAEATELSSMVKEAGSDAEMKALARSELDELEPRIEELGRKIQILLLPKDAADEKNAILEIRAGTGGDEAALFAADLYRMYTRYADGRGWTTELLSQSQSDLGGYKEISMRVSGQGVFARLKFESGVHRVQRVPATETGGRVHTSAATVAVLPEAEEVDIDIKPEDIRIDTMRASGAGGQHVNTTDSAVRVTHLPTGIIVVSAQKSQHQNRRVVMDVLRARLYDLERERTSSERSKDRKSQVGSGDRSQRIRTYNFSQGRVSDHRIGLTLHKLDEILAGTGLDELVDALTTHTQAEQLAQLSSDD